MKHKLAFLRLLRFFVGRSGNRIAVRTVCLALFLVFPLVLIPKSQSALRRTVEVCPEADRAG